MNAIMVSVDYEDLLAVTLPYNRHHFDRVTVVTCGRCEDSVRAVASPCGADVFVTEAFYSRGAAFNKWAALEEGLDSLGRVGWLCLMDADILWPRRAEWELVRGCLHGPLRRMAPAPDLDETAWGRYPLHRNVNEHAGYTQVFHADDPCLGAPPWHQVDWRHAGGADSFFQQKWPPRRKLRPRWECLHIGEAGVNWMGRADARPERRAAMQRLFAARRRNGLGPERLS